MQQDIFFRNEFYQKWKHKKLNTQELKKIKFEEKVREKG